MSTQEQFVQQFTKLFHHYSEALTPERAAQNATSNHESDRLVAAARLAILELESNGRMQQTSRRYYAKPGEAEWGC